MDGVLGIGFQGWCAIAASGIVVAAYILIAWARTTTEHGAGRYHPLLITAGVFGRGSLSNLQLLFFTLIVIWVLLYSFFSHGILLKLSDDVLLLLGIGAAGTAGAKITAIRKNRLSYENWAWLKRRKWIRDDIGRARRSPTWGDLVSSEDAFDVFKFQNIAFSLVVGAALLYAGLNPAATVDGQSLANFQIDQSLIGLLGLSQVAYVGGKAVPPSPVQELDRALTALRKLEAEFAKAVAEASAKATSGIRTIEQAREAAPVAYAAFAAAAGNAAEMLAERIGGRHPDMELEPRLQ